MAKKKDPQNLLDLKPVRLMEHLVENDLVVVQIPRFRSRWMGWLQRRLKKPCFQLHLDKIGSTVWLACDGESTVADIGKRLKDRFGEEIEPLWDRLALFIRQMASGKLIELRE
jgi:hypothetical protein